MENSKMKFFVFLYLFYSLYAYAIPTAVEEAKAGVVRIENSLGRGTGFFIQNNIIATNFHIVVSEDGLIPIEDIHIAQVGSQKENISIRIVGWQAFSPLNDLAFLKVEGYDGFTLPMEEPLTLDKKVYVLGFPGDSRDLQTIIGDDGVQDRDQMYEFFADFSNPAGSSGSPLLNSHAQLLGIISSGQHNFLKAEKADHIKKLLVESSAPEEFNRLEEPNTRGQRLFRKAMDHLEYLAEETGHTKAIYQIGKFYRLGVGFTKNEEAAMSFFTRAAAQGHNEAQNDIGVIHFHNNNYEKALIWFRKLIDQNHPMALLNFSQILLFEKPQEYDRETAMRALKIAAVQGAVHAQYLLALMHEKQGNYNEAVLWYNQSASRNYTPSQVKRAWIYWEEGNYEMAGMWLKRAILLRDSQAMQIKKVLLNGMEQNRLTPRERKLIELLK